MSSGDALPDSCSSSWRVGVRRQVYLIQWPIHSIVSPAVFTGRGTKGCHATHRTEGEAEMKVGEALEKGARAPLGCLVAMLLASVVLYYAFCPEGLMPGVTP